MPEAVIVATARSPIGRAFKGSLIDVRPDDLAATIVRAALDKVPGARPGRHRRPDARLRRAGRRAGRQHGPPGRGRARLRLPARHDGQPVLRLVGADLADGVPRDQGRRGRRVRLGRRRVRVAATRRSAAPARGDEEFVNPLFDEARARTEATAETERDLARPARGRPLPDVYISMGQTAENLATSRGITRAEQDEFGVRSQNLAEKAIADGFFEREITPVTTPDGTVVARDDGPRPGVTMEGVAGLKPVFRADGTVTAGNCCPLNDGAAAVVIMSDTKAAELGLTPLARIVSTGGQRPVAGDHGPRPGRGVAPALGAAGHDDRRHRPGRDQRGVRRAGDPVVPGRSASTSTGSTCTAARSRSATRSARPAPASRPRCSTACRAATSSSASRRCASAAARAWPWSSSA